MFEGGDRSFYVCEATAEDLNYSVNADFSKQGLPVPSCVKVARGQAICDKQMDHHNTATQVRQVHMNDMPNSQVNRKCTQSIAGNLIHSDGVRIDEHVLYSTWVLPPTNVPKTRARPKCQCRCGCRRRPGRRIACPGCGRACGPGCGPQMCFDPRVMRRCHECQVEPEPEPRQCPRR